MNTVRELANLIAGTTGLSETEAFNYLIDGTPSIKRTFREALATYYQKDVNASVKEILNLEAGTTNLSVREALNTIYLAM